jgi:hypothetical protein
MKIRPGRKPKSMLEFSKVHFFEAFKKYRGEKFKLGELAHRKSEQTTFSLSKEAIESIERLSTDAEVKVKEVIDQALERGMENLTGVSNEWGDEQAIFYKLTTPREDSKTRKTYVISLGALSLLNNLSLNFKIPRDMIMETIVIDYALFVKKSNEKKIQQYQLFYDRIIELNEIIERVLAEGEKLLGADDPITDNLDYMQYYASEAYQNIEKVLQDGKPLKPIRRIELKLTKVSDL